MASRPAELATIGKDNGWHGAALDTESLFEVLDEANCTSDVDTSLTTNDSMREDAEILGVLIEENNDPLRSLEVIRNEYRDMWLGFRSAKWKTEDVKIKHSKTLLNEIANGF
jgi:hypothetical protein